MTTKTENSMKRRAARLAADTPLNAALDAFNAEYQRAFAAVRAGTMTRGQMQAAIREAGRVRDAALAGRA